jgi:ABC-type polysaccharide/polyol phosphate transport system ATPase subunit
MKVFLNAMNVSLIVKAPHQTVLSFFSKKNVIPQTIINNISLNLNEGDKVAVIGSNGAGKSSLLRLLGATLLPSKGSIEHSHLPTCLLGGATTGLDVMLTGLESIRIFGIQNGMNKKTIRPFRQEIIEFCSLGSRIQDPIYTYSSGMRARLRFALVTSLDPTILIQDENILPKLDIEFRKKAQERLDRLHRNVGIFVSASHNIKDLSNCNRVLKIKEGKIEFFEKINALGLKHLLETGERLN